MMDAIEADAGVDGVRNDIAEMQEVINDAASSSYEKHRLASEPSRLKPYKERLNERVAANFTN